MSPLASNSTIVMPSPPVVSPALAPREAAAAASGEAAVVGEKEDSISPSARACFNLLASSSLARCSSAASASSFARGMSKNNLWRMPMTWASTVSSPWKEECAGTSSPSDSPSDSDAFGEGAVVSAGEEEIEELAKNIGDAAAAAVDEHDDTAVMASAALAELFTVFNTVRSRFTIGFSRPNALRLLLLLLAMTELSEGVGGK